MMPISSSWRSASPAFRRPARQRFGYGSSPPPRKTWPLGGFGWPCAPAGLQRPGRRLAGSPGFSTLLGTTATTQGWSPKSSRVPVSGEGMTLAPPTGLAPQRIPVGVPAEPGDVLLDDLLLVSDGHHLILWSFSQDRQVIPVLAADVPPATTARPVPAARRPDGLSPPARLVVGASRRRPVHPSRPIPADHPRPGSVGPAADADPCDTRPRRLARCPDKVADRDGPSPAQRHRR